MVTLEDIAAKLDTIISRLPNPNAAYEEDVQHREAKKQWEAKEYRDNVLIQKLAPHIKQCTRCQDECKLLFRHLGTSWKTRHYNPAMHRDVSQQRYDKIQLTLCLYGCPGYSNINIHYKVLRDHYLDSSDGYDKYPHGCESVLQELYGDEFDIRYKAYQQAIEV